MAAYVLNSLSPILKHWHCAMTDCSIHSTIHHTLCYKITYPALLFLKRYTNMISSLKPYVLNFWFNENKFLRGKTMVITSPCSINLRFAFWVDLLGLLTGLLWWKLCRSENLANIGMRNLHLNRLTRLRTLKNIIGRFFSVEFKKSISEKIKNTFVF